MIKIGNLTVRYGQNTVYENFNLEIEERGVTCVLGESGCGKTTLLNAVAGLIKFDGEVSPVTVSYVFQSPRLVPNLTAEGNLRLVGASKEEAAVMLESVGLSEKLKAFPAQMSGGEAQRVSLARAFLRRADLLLMDEPFSSLDLKTKISVMELFKTLCGQDGRGALFVTHDIDEALYLADRIIVLKSGRIVNDLTNANKGEFGANSPLRETIIKTLLLYDLPSPFVKREASDKGILF